MQDFQKEKKLFEEKVKKGCFSKIQIIQMCKILSVLKEDLKNDMKIFATKNDLDKMHIKLLYKIVSVLFFMQSLLFFLIKILAY